jgi:hypothetical protein
MKWPHIEIWDRLTDSDDGSQCSLIPILGDADTLRGWNLSRLVLGWTVDWIISQRRSVRAMPTHSGVPVAGLCIGRLCFSLPGEADIILRLLEDHSQYINTKHSYHMMNDARNYTSGVSEYYSQVWRYLMLDSGSPLVIKPPL